MPCRDNSTTLAVLFILLVLFVIYVVYIAHNGVFLRSHDGRYLSLKNVNGTLQFVMNKRRAPSARWRLSLWNRTLFNVKWQTLVYWQLSPAPLVNIYTGPSDAQSAEFQQLPMCPFYDLPIRFGDEHASYCVDSGHDQMSLVKVSPNKRPPASCLWRPVFGGQQDDDQDGGAHDSDDDDEQDYD